MPDRAGSRAAETPDILKNVFCGKMHKKGVRTKDEQNFIFEQEARVPRLMASRRHGGAISYRGNMKTVLWHPVAMMS